MAAKDPTEEAEGRAFLRPTVTAASRYLSHIQRGSSRLLDVGVPDDLEGALDAGGERGRPEGLLVDVSTPVEPHLARSSSAADERQASASMQSGTMTGRAGPIIRSLQARLERGFDTAAIAQQVEAELVAFSEARVTQFISILVERRVWERISASGPLTPARREAGTGST